MNDRFSSGRGQIPTGSSTRHKIDDFGGPCGHFTPFALDPTQREQFTKAAAIARQRGGQLPIGPDGRRSNGRFPTRPVRSLNDQRSVYGRGHRYGPFAHLQPQINGRLRQNDTVNPHVHPPWSSNTESMNERQSMDSFCRPSNRSNLPHPAATPAQTLVKRKRPYRDLDVPSKEPCLVPLVPTSEVVESPKTAVKEEAEEGEIVDPTPSPSPPAVDEPQQTRIAPLQKRNLHRGHGVRQMGRRCPGRQRTDDPMEDEFEKELRAAELDTVRATCSIRNRPSHQAGQISPYPKHQRKRHVGLPIYSGPALDADKILRHLTEGGHGFGDHADMFTDAAFAQSNDDVSFQRRMLEEGAGMASSPAKRMRSEEHRSNAADDADELCKDFGDVLVISRALAKENKLVLRPATFSNCDEFGDKWRDFRKHILREYKQYNGCSRLAKPLTSFNCFSALKECLDAHELSAKENIVLLGRLASCAVPNNESLVRDQQLNNVELKSTGGNSLPSNLDPSVFLHSNGTMNRKEGVARSLPPQRIDRMSIVNESAFKEAAPVNRNKPANCGDINSPTLELLSKWAANNLKNFPLTTSLLPSAAQPVPGVQMHRNQQHFPRTTPFIGQVHRHNSPMAYQSGRIGRRNPVANRQMFGDPEKMRDDFAKITSALIELRKHYVMRSSFQ